MVQEFACGKDIDHILIGGHPEMFEKIKKHLPKHLKDKVIGEFVTELNIPITKVFRLAKNAADKIQAIKAGAFSPDCLDKDGNVGSLNQPY